MFMYNQRTFFLYHKVCYGRENNPSRDQAKVSVLARLIYGHELARGKATF